jgi:hypothetical protein
VASAGEDAACGDGAVEGDGQQDLEVGEADDDVLVGAIGADAEPVAERVSEILRQAARVGLGQVVGRVGCVNVDFGVLLRQAVWVRVWKAGKSARGCSSPRRS